MASRISEALNADGMSLTLFTGGTSKIGVGVSGTWVGTVSFSASADGVTFNPVTVTPFASGTGVQTTTGNGNWEYATQNYVAFRATFARTSGAAVVVIAASQDASYQAAFLSSTSRFVEQDASGGSANTITVGAQANRAWRCRTVSGGFSAAPAAAVKVTISDGASNLLWAEYVAAAAGQWKLNLPLDHALGQDVGGGVVGTPGNSMVITVSAPGGSVATSVSAEMSAA